VISKEHELYGLILSGGQSSRMGQDKSTLKYHDKPQLEYLFDLVQELLPNTFVSVKQGQSLSFTHKVIEDQLETKGPINGIISAMQTYPKKAWLVIACDLPLLSNQTISQLINERDPSKHATAFATRESGLPEPLVAIWEPGALEPLKVHHLEQQRNCPRKFLINTEIKLIHPQNDLELYNANSPEEYERAKAIIG
jgi:molybdopterin-guanine dinucleotide biosynthesis protein A